MCIFLRHICSLLSAKKHVYLVIFNSIKSRVLYTSANTIIMRFTGLFDIELVSILWLNKIVLHLLISIMILIYYSLTMIQDY